MDRDSKVREEDIVYRKINGKYVPIGVNGIPHQQGVWLVQVFPGSRSSCYVSNLGDPDMWKKINVLVRRDELIRILQDAIQRRKSLHETVVMMAAALEKAD